MKRPSLFLLAFFHCLLAWSSPEVTPQPLLNDRTFTALDGQPGYANAVAQTPDGMLWVGGPTGLTRFDGARFVHYPAPEDEPLPSTHITTLHVTPDGGLWIGYRFGGATLLKSGHGTHFAEREGFPSNAVVAFAQDRSGSVWVATRSTLARLDGNRWVADAQLTNIKSLLAFVIDRSGTQWVATPEALLARPAGQGRFFEVLRRPFAEWPRTVIAEAPDGKIWAATLHDLIRVDRAAPSQGGTVVSLHGFAGKTLLPIAFDRGGDLWAASFGSVLRVRHRDLMREESLGDVEVEVLSRASRPVDTYVTSMILEDREGNVWVGGEARLDRFSRGRVVPTPVGCIAAGAAGPAGSMWVACRLEPATSQFQDGVLVRRQATAVFSAAYREPDGTVWFGGPNVLAHIENGLFVETPLPPQARDADVQAIARDGDGALWVSVDRRGLFVLKGGAWSEYGGLAALPRGYVSVMTAQKDGPLWIGYTGSRVARVAHGVVRVFGPTSGLDVGTVLSISAKAGELWVGGELGLARLDGDRFVSMRHPDGAAFRGTSGILPTQDGDLWLNGDDGISHIERREIDRAIGDPSRRMAAETFDRLDGLPGTAVRFRPLPSAIEDTDGRMWFMTNAGMVSIDSKEIVRNTEPPPVTIWTLASGDVRYRNMGETLRLPLHTANLQIEYGAGSLTLPERVRFRYRLVGIDRDWQDVGTRREAFYTNLSPGQYRFQVIACNNDGVWNLEGASISFMIPPPYYQTAWFYLLCALACFGFVFAVYALRVRQVSAQIRGRLEARLGERERIARELHDTLLQGMQGLILRFQAATDRIPANEPARRLMEQSLDRADRLLGESRDKVKDLRPATNQGVSLEEALAAEGAQFDQLASARFRVSVEGASRSLHPIVREEGFLIGREAIANAFAHARSDHVEVEITYGDHALLLRIRDDGQGVGSAVLDSGGKPGHFGVLGMRERAMKLGASFDLWSKPGAGTEVVVRIPAEVAYLAVQRDPGRLRHWMASLRSALSR